MNSTLSFVDDKNMDKLSVYVKANIFDIQRFSIHDGPGIRTTVFIKGCPLDCLWCSNPESKNIKSEILFMQHLCTHCGRCVPVCPFKANSILGDGTIALDRKKCQGCEKCVNVCLADARSLSGKVMTLGEVMEIIDKDAVFYSGSGGGVTASGGEAASQPEFLLNLFRECGKRGYHTLLDTSGYVPWKSLEPVMEYTDLVYFDIKHMDSSSHEKIAGTGNELILENARRIMLKSVPLVIRIPLVRGWNDSVENIENIAKFSKELGGVEVDLLPYHDFGVGKYSSLGLVYELNPGLPWEEKEVETIAELIRSHGVPVEIV